LHGGSAGRPFLKKFFLIRENFFQRFRTEFSSSFYVISLALKISCCLSANHNPELRCVICTCVTLELHCSQPIRRFFLLRVFFFLFLSISIVKFSTILRMFASGFSPKHVKCYARLESCPALHPHASLVKQSLLKNKVTVVAKTE